MPDIRGQQVVHRAAAALVFCLVLHALAAAPARGGNYTVTNTNDSGSGSLREAISKANSAGGSSIIMVSIPGIIRLASALPSITCDLTILSGQGEGLVVDGGDGCRPFSIASGTDVSLSGFTVANGRTSGHGGAIHNAGSLLLNDFYLRGNVAGRDGGAIYSTGSLEVHNSSITGNRAAGDGGGVHAPGPVKVNSCVFSGNRSGGAAGIRAGQDLDITLTEVNETLAKQAVVCQGTLTMTKCLIRGHPGTALRLAGPGGHQLVNSTFSGNHVSLLADGEAKLAFCTVTGSDTGLLLGQGGSAELTSCIVQGNGVDVDVDSEPGGVALNGANLVAAVAGGSLHGDTDELIQADPGLEPLADNGGRTMTHALPDGSEAMDAATVDTAPDGTVVDTDQRERNRFAGPRDLGAVEFIDPLAVYNDKDRGEGSLDMAVWRANDTAGPDTVNFRLPLPAVIAPARTLSISEDVHIEGPGADLLTVTGDGSASVFRAGEGVAVAISGLSVTGGWSPDPDVGAGIHAAGTLGLSGCEVSGNDGPGAAALSGGGLSGCLFSGNLGPGLAVTGDLDAVNCTFDNNRVGISAGKGHLRLAYCTLSGSTDAGLALADPASAELASCLAYGNAWDVAAGGCEVLLEGANLVGTFVGGDPSGDTHLRITDDPLLGPLADNGGATMTRAPADGSTAMDAATVTTDPNGTQVAVDQRGEPRPSGSGCDLGALEVQQPPLSGPNPDTGDPDQGEAGTGEEAAPEVTVGKEWGGCATLPAVYWMGVAVLAVLWGRAACRRLKGGARTWGCLGFGAPARAAGHDTAPGGTRARTTKNAQR